MDLLLDGAVERGDFQAKKLKICEQQISLENNMKGARTADDAFKDAFLALLNLAAESRKLFAISTPAQKRRLLRAVSRQQFSDLEKSSRMPEWLCRQSTDNSSLAQHNEE